MSMSALTAWAAHPVNDIVNFCWEDKNFRNLGIYIGAVLGIFSFARFCWAPTGRSWFQSCGMENERRLAKFAAFTCASFFAGIVGCGVGFVGAVAAPFSIPALIIFGIWNKFFKA